MSRVSQLGAWFLKIGFLKQLLINLTFTVHTTTCSGARAVTAMGWHQGRRNADCLFSIYHRLVGQVTVASWPATTIATNGKSPSHSSTAD